MLEILYARARLVVELDAGKWFRAFACAPWVGGLPVVMRMCSRGTVHAASTSAARRPSGTCGQP